MCGSCEVKDDFIGQTFPTPKGGVLTVVGISDRKSNGTKVYKLTCSVCHKDKELFPDLFESVKSSLVNDQAPCGCSKTPRWKPFQIIILINRHLDKVGKYEGNKFVGFDGGEYKGVNSTKVILNCPEHGEYRPTYNNLIRKESGCAKCGIETTRDKNRNSKAEIITKELCGKEGYEYIGFPEGYKNAFSKFEYNCPIHGKQIVEYKSFSNGHRCPSCATYGYQPAKPGHLYVTNWINYNKDTNEFFKIGITNFLEQRIKQQARKTSYKPHHLIVFKFEDGSIPQELERITTPYRQNMEHPIITQDEFSDGTTEILQNWIDIIKILPELIDTIRQKGYTPEIEVGKRLYNKLIKLDKSDMAQAILNHLYK